MEKFRVWHKGLNAYVDNFLLSQQGFLVSAGGKVGNRSRIILELCSGVNDSFGTPIYDGDLVYSTHDRLIGLVKRDGAGWSFANWGSITSALDYMGIYIVVGNINQHKLLAKLTSTSVGADPSNLKQILELTR